MKRSAGACKSCGESIKRNERVIESTKLYKACKLWRTDKQNEKGLGAAFMVASNRTLRDIVVFRPENEHSMLDIHGIGPKRYDNFEFASLFKIIKSFEDEILLLEVECDVCREGRIQSSGSPSPNNHLHISSGGSNSCPTCGKPDWDGVFRNTGVSGIKPLPNPDEFSIKHIHNTDFTDGQLEDNAHGNGFLDVEIRGVNLDILSRIVDHYLEQRSVRRVFAFQNPSSSFTYTPEWVSGSLNLKPGVNRSGFWRCRFSHTTNNGSCNSCGADLNNNYHHLCYSCWKKENGD